MNIIPQIKKILAEGFSLNNPFDESYITEKGIRDANGTAYKSFFFGALGSLIIYLYLPNPYIWVSIVVTASYLLTLLFNYLKWYLIAKANAWIVSVFAFFILASIYGYESGFHYLYVVISLAIVFKHQQRDIIPTVLPIILTIFAIIILYITDFSLLKTQIFSPQSLKILNNYCFFSCLSSCIFMGIYAIKGAEQKNKKILLLKEIEQKVLRSQINPHFIFNVLNSIQAYILEQNDDDAIRFLGKFSRLIRKILQNSKFPTISLAQELETLSLYIDLEKFRLSQGLEYELQVAQDIDIKNVQIPPIILQPIVENAIWNSIAPSKKAGKITISIQKQRKELCCKVQDNGLGIEYERSKNNEYYMATLENVKERLSHFAEQSEEYAKIERSNNHQEKGSYFMFNIPLRN